MPGETLRDFTAVVAPVLVASILTFVPLESVLSVYPVPQAFPWYVPWRGAFVSVILWLISGALYSERRYWLKEFFLGAAASFIAFHYWLLYIVSRFTSVTLLPFVYFVGGSPPVLDLGQVVAVLTAFAYWREILAAARATRIT